MNYIKLFGARAAASPKHEKIDEKDTYLIDEKDISYLKDIWYKLDHQLDIGSIKVTQYQYTYKSEKVHVCLYGVILDRKISIEIDKLIKFTESLTNLKFDAYSIWNYHILLGSSTEPWKLITFEDVINGLPKKPLNIRISFSQK